ncbi:hypothetical protein U9R62_13270 [Cylindrospermopsis raciborskii DSH]|uniref:ribonuclease toxin HepT-like protein n=1 Tax=Cylindrospermopsis raciborskii TaxID=77022 RepID=UPI002EDA27C9
MHHDSLPVLIAEIEESQKVLTDLEKLYNTYKPFFTDESKRDIRDAVLLADIFCNTYTCLETIFLRISREFENHLDDSQWHKELLRKMRIEIPGIRQALLSHHSYQLLDELRRFRHFKRYYYDFNYDWSRLDYLANIYERAIALVFNELTIYIAFLQNLINI